MTSQIKTEGASNCMRETGDGGSGEADERRMDDDKGTRTVDGGRCSRRDSLEDLQCPICMDLFIDPTMTDCSHVFCNFCITYWFANRGRSICPQCRNAVVSMFPARVIQEKVERYISENYSKEMLEERERTKEARQNQEEVGFTPDEMAILDEYLAMDSQVDEGNMDDLFWQMTAETPEAATTSFTAWSYSGLTPSTVYTTLADTMAASEEYRAPQPRLGTDGLDMNDSEGMSRSTMNETLQQFELRLERAQRAYGVLASAQREMNHQLTHLQSISERLERYNNQILSSRLNLQFPEEPRERRTSRERPVGNLRRGSDSLLTSGSETRFMDTERLIMESAGRCPAHTRSRDASFRERRCHFSEHGSRHSMLNNSTEDRHNNNTERSASNYSTILPELYQTMYHPSSPTPEAAPRFCRRRASNASTCINNSSDNCRSDTAALPSLGISVRSTSSLNIFRPRHRRGRRCCTPIEITTTIYGDDPVQNMLSRERTEERELSQAVGQALMMEILEPSYGSSLSNLRSSASSIRPGPDIQLPSLRSDPYSATDYLSSDTASDSHYRRLILNPAGRRYMNNHGSSN